MKVELLFIIIILSLAVFNCLILILRNARNLSNDSMLVASLFFYNFCVLVYYFWFEAGYIIQMPHLLRTLSPVMYLCAPFFYFFIRESVGQSRGLHKSDILHFIPALFHLIDLVPFFMEPYAVKLAYAQIIVNDSSQISKVASGLIPIKFHYIFRILLQTGYYLICIRLVYSANKSGYFKQVHKENSKNWLITLLFFMGWVVAFQLSFAFFGLMTNFGLMYSEDLNHMLRISSLFGIFLLNLYINFKPGFLFSEANQRSVFNTADWSESLSRIDEAPEEKKMVKIRKRDFFFKLNDQEHPTSEIKSQIISTLERDKVFTEIGINISKFSTTIGLHPKLVSQVINSEFGIGFNELINQYRVVYAVEKIEEGYLDDFTLEALGNHCGFNSRTTFFNAFKKEKGKSPSEYWKNFQETI